MYRYCRSLVEWPVCFWIQCLFKLSEKRRASKTITCLLVHAHKSIQISASQSGGSTDPQGSLRGIPKSYGGPWYSRFEKHWFGWLTLMIPWIKLIIHQSSLLDKHENLKKQQRKQNPDGFPDTELVCILTIAQIDQEILMNWELEELRTWLSNVCLLIDKHTNKRPVCNSLMERHGNQIPHQYNKLWQWDTQKLYFKKVKVSHHCMCVCVCGMWVCHPARACWFEYNPNHNNQRQTPKQQW